MAITRIRHRRGTPTVWTDTNETLGAAEWGIEIAVDGTVRAKIGNGTDAWDDLPYFGEGGGGTMSAAAILAALVTVDGPGSGLNADLLDGVSAGGFETAGAAAAAQTAAIAAAAALVDDLSGVTNAAAARAALGVVDKFPVTFSVSLAVLLSIGQHRIYVEEACVIESVRASVGTAPTGATLIVDVNKNGTTIFTTQSRRPAIAISGFTAVPSGAIEVTALAAGDYLTVDVDQNGSTITGSDLTVTIWLRRA